jgi:ubiquinone/menaquinone biosynthesis C-methylase UbiE
MQQLLASIYKARYSERSEKAKGEIWKVLISDFLQQFVKPTDTVVDIAAGHCEFINHIHAAKKYAVDIEPRIKHYANKDVQIIVCDATKLPKTLNNKVDVVFMGCFLEHLPSKDAIIELLLGIKRILRKGGKLMILNPNIRFSTADYWDYFDHLTPVSDRSVVEVLMALGYELDIVIPRFVPNTVKDRLPKSPFLVKLYLHLPFLFPIFGKQMFIVASTR